MIRKVVGGLAALVLAAGVAVGMTGTAHADPSSVQQVSNPHTFSVGGTTANLSATCPAGTVVTGGGYEIGGFPRTQAYGELADIANNKWTVSFADSGSGGWSVTTYAVCLSD
jgi:hypothetical protein